MAIIAGSKFRARADVHIKGIIVYGGPYSGGFEGVLRKGEVVRCETKPRSDSGTPWFRPENYQRLEQEFVSEKVRKNPEYSGYALSIPRSSLEKYFEPVE